MRAAGLTGAAAGFLGGLVGGLTGLGGGTVMVPIMVSVLGLSQHTAHGTSLVAVLCNGIAGALVYGRHRSLNITDALFIASAAVLTAHLGAMYAHALTPKQLKRSFGLFLIAITPLIVLRPYLPPAGVVQDLWHRDLVLLLTGALAGFVSGMLGMGGGTVVVPAMVLLLASSQREAQGASLLAMIPAGLAGVYTHLENRSVNARVAMYLIPGVLAGTALGGNLAHRLPDSLLRLVFALALAGIGLRYARQTTAAASTGQAARSRAAA